MQKIDTWRRLSRKYGRIAFAALITLGVGSTYDAVGTNQAPAFESTELDGEVVAPRLDSSAVDARNPETEEPSVGAAGSGTWQFFHRESCWDLWMTSCSVTWPPDQCPPNPAGKPCTTPDACWHVISAGTVDRYRCVAN